MKFGINYKLILENRNRRFFDEKAQERQILDLMRFAVQIADPQKSVAKPVISRNSQNARIGVYCGN
jgi:hypothetical protein